MEFAKRNRVLYINIPLSRNALRKEKDQPNIQHHFRVIRGEADPLEKIHTSLWNYFPKRIHESINWIPSTKLFSYVNLLNNKRLAMDIQEAANRLGFENYILFNDNDIFRGYWLKELLTPQLYIYYCRDFLTSSGYFKKHGNTIEPLHIAKADLALSNSHYLTEYLNKYNLNAHFVGQGCDTALFNADNQYDIPSDLVKKEKPFIGYVGNLTVSRLDLSILLTVAENQPNWQIILVGPEDDEFKKSKLHQLLNVTFTGKKNLEQLPAYIQAFDVCINPQLANKLTMGNYPLKIDEYLAMGKPVVATNTDAMEMFRDYCYLAENPGAYVTLINSALAENSLSMQKERINFARQHSWENSVSDICYHIASTLSRQSIAISQPDLMQTQHHH
jgi:glycosyltransferase involved in cell wall biosynthesis